MPLTTATHECRRGKIVHFAGDACIGMALARYGEWGETELALLRPYIPAGGTVIDVGAHVGTHALGFAEFVGADGSVIAIEAQPETFCLLCANVANNGKLRIVTPINALAGDRSGVHAVTLFHGSAPDNAGARSFLRELNEGARPGAATVQITMLTLDSLDLPRCDLIKIDVEGMELLVLRGAQNLLARAQSLVYFEHATGNANELAAIDNLLSPLGYRLFWHRANPYNAQNWKGDAHNIFGGAVEINVLACPPQVPLPAGLVAISAQYASPNRVGP